MRFQAAKLLRTTFPPLASYCARSLGLPSSVAHACLYVPGPAYAAAPRVTDLTLRFGCLDFRIRLTRLSSLPVANLSLSNPDAEGLTVRCA
jgi:hypothetical protein